MTTKTNQQQEQTNDTDRPRPMARELARELPEQALKAQRSKRSGPDAAYQQPKETLTKAAEMWQSPEEITAEQLRAWRHACKNAAR